MITIPAEVGRKFGIKPATNWIGSPLESRDEILVRVIPDQGELARWLVGLGAHLAPERDVIAELDGECKRSDEYLA